MKIFSYILIGIAILLLAVNVTKVNWQDPLAEDSGVALIGIAAALCAILLVVILRMSVKIKSKRK